LVFLSNQFALPATTVCALYKARWQVELFFKWVKQHLRIKRFYATSENAVKSQIPPETLPCRRGRSLALRDDA
jgi:IS4 transposase